MTGTANAFILTSLTLYCRNLYGKLRKTTISGRCKTDFKEGVKILDRTSRIIDSKYPPFRYIDEVETSNTLSDLASNIS
jgi:hypothetical protein